jgi:iron complex transport system substrate-binding protein
MNKWRCLLLAVLFWAGAGFAIFGVSENQNLNDTSVVRKPFRIVSMAPNLTEILFALGLGERVVAVSSDSDYPPETAEKDKVGTFWQLNMEAVIAAKPDLVIALGFRQQKELARRLRRIGYNASTLNIETVSQLYEAIDQIGRATRTQMQANALAADMREKLGRLTSLLGKKERVKVLYVVQRQPLRVAGRDTFVNEIIELAGGEIIELAGGVNAIGPTLHKYPAIGSEQVITCGAEVIIEPAMGQNDLNRQQDSAIQYWSRFAELPAVRDRRVCVIDADTVSRLGPRLYGAVEKVARCLRPELFAD